MTDKDVGVAGNVVRGNMVIEVEGDKGIFKPVEFFSNGYGTEPSNEYMAFYISEYLRFRLVPYTVFNRINVKVGEENKALTGSLQEYIKKDITTFDKLEDNELRYLQEEITLLIIFDSLIANTDRKPENTLIARKEKSIYAVDHGFSLGFHHDLEAEKRDDHEEYTVSLFDTEARLGINRRLLNLFDADYAIKVIRKIQDGKFNIDMEILKDLYKDDNVVYYVDGGIKHRLNFLPYIVFNQL